MARTESGAPAGYADGILHGPVGPEIEQATLTFPGFLSEVARRHGPREAIVFDDPLRQGATRRWSYNDLWQESRDIAAALVAAGVVKGQHVGVFMGNRPEAVAAIFATTAVGGVAVLLPTFSPPDELSRLLRHGDVTVLLTQRRLRRRDVGEEVAGMCPWLTGPRPRGDARLPNLRRVVVLGPNDPGDRRRGPAWHSWDAFVEAGCDVDGGLLDALASDVVASDRAVVIYSSGTTETPKGVLHHHRAATLQFWQQAGIFGRTGETRMWTALPLFWTAGLNSAVGSTLAAGACWVAQETFEPGPAISLMSRERVTEPYTLPHQTARLEEHPDWAGADLSSLRSVFGKSAFARHPTAKGDPDWQMPVGYGLTETCAFFCAHPSTAGREERKASMGALLPGNELRVVDPVTGRALGPGEEGELTVRGPTLMMGYIKRSREESFDADGFFHTGDIGYYDPAGELHFSGRRTEVIRTGGANVSPAEIEVQLRACPPVGLARVLRWPDDRLGEIPVLCVETKEGMSSSEEEIMEFLRGRLASYKLPRRVLFFATGEMPLVHGGTKVRDDVLRPLVEQRIAADAAQGDGGEE